jgi:hypothetical protein
VSKCLRHRHLHLAAFVVLRRGGYRVPLMSVRIARSGTWVLVGLMAVGAIANFASSGEWGRFGWDLFTLLLTALCLVVARTRVAASFAR